MLLSTKIAATNGANTASWCSGALCRNSLAIRDCSDFNLALLSILSSPEPPSQSKTATEKSSLLKCCENSNALHDFKSANNWASENLKGKVLPNQMHRQCTHYMKFKPILEWWHKTIGETCDMRIGFRYGEERRKNKIDERLIDGYQWDKVIVGKSNNGRNKWENKRWRTLSYPLIDDVIKSIDVDNYWKKNKQVGFKKGYYNNCVGCFHRNPLFLNKMAQEHKNKMQWFADQEDGTKYWRDKKELYKDIIKFQPQFELKFNDFNECDSGYCGL